MALRSPPNTPAKSTGPPSPNPNLIYDWPDWPDKTVIVASRREGWEEVRSDLFRAIDTVDQGDFRRNPSYGIQIEDTDLGWVFARIHTTLDFDPDRHRLWVDEVDLSFATIEDHRSFHAAVEWARRQTKGTELCLRFDAEEERPQRIEIPLKKQSNRDSTSSETNSTDTTDSTDGIDSIEGTGPRKHLELSPETSPKKRIGSGNATDSTDGSESTDGTYPKKGIMG